MYAAYPVYYPTMLYAREHYEMELWQESNRINRELADLMTKKASGAYHGRTLPDFIKEITDTYGLERSVFVLARTIVDADWDKRYDDDVRERVNRVDFQERTEAKRRIREGAPKYAIHDTSIGFTCNVHPCILNDIFRSLMKMEQEQANLPQASVSQDNELDEGAEQ